MRIYNNLMPSDLPILNAEQYIGTADLGSTGKAEKVKKGPKARSEGPRKRAKTSSTAIVTKAGDDDDNDNDDDEEEEDDDDADANENSKRSRGRPRLDTKDQSAADRRRTQIRLAQRAYRSRKENAIQTLENEVKVLQETKEEMSNAFMKLHDFAVSQGILEKTPAFAKELRSTSEKFLMLANKPSESGGQDSPAASTGEEAGPGPSNKSRVKAPEKANSPKVGEIQQPPTMGESVWGYTFTTEAQADPALTMPDPDLDLKQPPATQLAVIQTPLGYETVTMPTLDNASFPFDAHAQDSFFTQGALRTVQQNLLTPDITPPAFSPSTSSSLPLPLTMAYAEATFGRRLQRSTIEFAYRLCSVPNTTSEQFVKAFGFCLLFESVEQIRARLHKALEKTRQESLNNWRVPFWALGGIGQHQSGGQAPQHRPVGNQGTIDVAKHAFGTSFGIGPFDSATTEARDLQLDATMRILLPGFHGEFFDPDEVEVYLQSRGVCIQPGQDYVTAEVAMEWFQAQQQQQQEEETDLYGQWVADMMPLAGKTSETTTIAAVDGTWISEKAFADTQAATNLLRLSENRKLSMANQKQIVTLNVDVFIQELMQSAVCLGRTPAYRQGDINKAFWKATRGDG